MPIRFTVFTSARHTVFEVRHTRGETGAIECVVECGEERGALERFGDKVGGAQCHRLPCGNGIVVAGEGDDRRVRILPTDAAEELIGGGAGEMQVEQHGDRRRTVDRGNGSGGIGEGNGSVAGVLDPAFEEEPEVAVIVNDDDASGAGGEGGRGHTIW